MNLESLRDFCLQLPGAEESFPFGNDTLVFKVKNKVFLLTSLDSVELGFNVKCDPEKAIELREQYNWVLPGYHMNKKHWNTVKAGDRAPDALLKSWITDSYQLVVQSLPKKSREELQWK
jgi:predicted DNA-binding protein (MmcQ/YjbR family)